MPFLTEEIWHLIKERDEDIIVASWPQSSKVDSSILNSFNIGAEVISGIRNIRKSKQIPNKESLSLYIKINDEFDKSIDTLIAKMSNIDRSKDDIIFRGKTYINQEKDRSKSLVDKF